MCDSSTMPDRLCCLVKTIVGSLPVEDPHVQQRQQQSIVNLRLVDHTEPFGPSDHMGPQPIIEVKVQEDVIPPAMVGSCLVLSLLVDPVEGSLGNLQTSLQCFYQEETKREITSSVVG